VSSYRGCLLKRINELAFQFPDQTENAPHQKAALRPFD